MKKSLLFCALSAIFAASSLPVSAEQSSAPVAQHQQQLGFELIKQSVNKSPNDKAIYQGIQLNNGMTVLLISDPKANKSLMSVAVEVGSMEDPLAQQGLAHYLEHMILMGSKNYPKTNSLDEFLNKNGGYNNASTSDTRTIYYLEVNNNAFDEATARLADTLAQPLLSESNAKKEINAVNAEMVRAKSSDGHLSYSVALATTNPEHPITKFTVGNKETLSDKPNSKLQTELENFYQKHYSANLMKAVLYSNQSIEQLAKLAEKTLGKVANKKLTVQHASVPLYREQDKGIVMEYKPVQPHKTLEIEFHFPDDKGHFKNKSYDYLSYIFTNTGEGTLSDYLIKNGLSDSGILANGSDKLGRNESLFSIYVALTDKGFAQKDQIISLIFQQIEKIKQEGIQDSYFAELKTSLSQRFEHLQTEKSATYIEGLAEQMLNYPLENIIDSAFIVEDMDKAEIADKLAGMTVDNARIFLTHDNAKTDKKTPYMQAGYSVQKIANEQKAKWLDFSHNPAIQLPKLNPYFATDFSLNAVDTARTKPKLIEQGKGTLIYAMPSHDFPNEPKAVVAMGFSLPTYSDDIKAYIASHALNYMSELAQANTTFQASVAGMGYAIAAGENGLLFSVNGYTQHLARLAKDALDKFATAPLTEADLAQAKQRMLESLDQQEKENSARQAVRAFNEISDDLPFSIEHKRQAIQALTLNEVVALRQRLLNEQSSVEAFSLGNLSDEQVKNLIATASESVKHSNDKLIRPRYVDFRQLSDKVNVITASPHEDNALSLVYLVKGDDELANTTRAGLVSDIISRWYFDDLRTEKQLGYVVYASTERVGKTSGLSFLVQSPNATPEQIMQHNQRFFKQTLTRLEQLSNADFEQYRASQLDKLQQKPESLAEEFEDYQFDFLRNNAKFDRIEQRIAALKKVTKQEVIDFYRQAVIEQSGFVMASQVIGTKANKGQVALLEGFKTISDIEAYNRTLPRMEW